MEVKKSNLNLMRKEQGSHWRGIMSSEVLGKIILAKGELNKLTKMRVKEPTYNLWR